MSEEIITIRAEDKDFSVLRGPIESKSQIVKSLIEELGENPDWSKQVVILGNDITAKTFEHIVEWINQHKDDPAPAPKVAEESTITIPEEKKKIEIPECDKAFFAKLDQEALFKLIMASNYLDIKTLLDYCCATVADSVLGKTPKQIYDMFHVTEELTPEEEAEVRKENPWLEDN